MSRIRPWTNGDQVALNAGRVPVYQDEKEVRLYDANGAPIVLESDKVPVLSTLADGPQIDAFSRLRVSTPQAVFDNTFQYDLRPWRFSNSLTGAGSITHVPDEAEAQLSTGGTTSGDKAILQTKRYIRYEPGKSQLVLITARMGAQKADVRQRIGLFDDDNGLFFEQIETDVKVVVRSATSGSPVDTAVSQADWNLDKLDGTGVSGVTLDLSKNQIFIIDYQWLGVGRVRFGFDLDGVVVYCHEIVHANTSSTVYMTRPHLPIRASIENTGTAASETTMDQYCIAVMSEGGVTESPGDHWAIGRGTTRLGVTTTRRPVLSLRPGPTFNSIVNRGHLAFDMSEIQADTNDCLWEVVIGGTLTGASWTAVDATYSIAQYDTSATAISGGQSRIRGWAFAGLGAAPGSVSDAGIVPLELFNDFAGTTPDILSLVCTSFTGTANVLANLHWTEQR